MTLPVLCFFLSFSLFSFPLFSFPLFSFCFFLCFLFAFVSNLSLFLFSSLLSYMLLLFLLLTDFSHLFLFIYYYYFLSSLFCLYSFTTSAHWLGVLSLILYTVSAVWHSSTCYVVSSFWLHIGHFVSSSSLG